MGNFQFSSIGQPPKSEITCREVAIYKSAQNTSTDYKKKSVDLCGAIFRSFE